MAEQWTKVANLWGPTPPAGGDAGAFLVKSSATDYEMEWAGASTVATPQDVAGAVAAEAAAREKQDGLISDEVAGKLAPGNVVAGAHISATPDLEAGTVTVASTMTAGTGLSFSGEALGISDGGVGTAQLADASVTAAKFGADVAAYIQGIVTQALEPVQAALAQKNMASLATAEPDGTANPGDVAVEEGTGRAWVYAEDE